MRRTLRWNPSLSASVGVLKSMDRDVPKLRGLLDTEAVLIPRDEAIRGYHNLNQSNRLEGANSRDERIF
jgi:hypothetical protein